ncbi:hypothetical protein CDV55_108084 [Aspergillus turcosus]|nr:hypothetical protein CDV55_108084 [Aspergillus turcosus]
MVPKSIPYFWLCLLVATTLADQTPPASNNACFTSTSTSPKENYNACCQDGKLQSGTGSAGGAQFTYRCGYYPEPTGHLAATNANSMQDCAALCAKDTGCVAGAWNYRDRSCYLTAEMTSTQQSVLGQPWVLLEKRAEPDCSQADAALHECEKAKNDCQDTRSTCQAQLATRNQELATSQAAERTCQAENKQWTDGLRSCPYGSWKTASLEGRRWLVSCGYMIKEIMNNDNGILTTQRATYLTMALDTRPTRSLHTRSRGGKICAHSFVWIEQYEESDYMEDMQDMLVDYAPWNGDPYGGR